MKRIVLILALAVTPQLSSAKTLNEALYDYVVAYEPDALNKQARASLRAIIDDPSRTHAEKVLRIHSVLEQNNALEHVDIHGAPLNAPLHQDRTTALLR